jgi:hypothetical protein
VRKKRQKRQKPSQVTSGVVLSKLSKLLNQGDALSIPCLRGISASAEFHAERRKAAERPNQSLLM